MNQNTSLGMLCVQMCFLLLHFYSKSQLTMLSSDFIGLLVLQQKQLYLDGNYSIKVSRKCTDLWELGPQSLENSKCVGTENNKSISRSLRMMTNEAAFIFPGSCMLLKYFLTSSTHVCVCTCVCVYVCKCGRMSMWKSKVNSMNKLVSSTIRFLGIELRSSQWP